MTRDDGRSFCPTCGTTHNCACAANVTVRLYDWRPATAATPETFRMPKVPTGHFDPFGLTDDEREAEALLIPTTLTEPTKPNRAMRRKMARRGW